MLMDNSYIYLYIIHNVIYLKKTSGDDRPGDNHPGDNRPGDCKQFPIYKIINLQ